MGPFVPLRALLGASWGAVGVSRTLLWTLLLAFWGPRGCLWDLLGAESLEFQVGLPILASSWVLLGGRLRPPGPGTHIWGRGPGPGPPDPVRRYMYMR
eukprot:7920525-Pyramimonas_sp.AAC.1